MYSKHFSYAFKIVYTSHGLEYQLLKAVKMTKEREKVSSRLSFRFPKRYATVNPIKFVCSCVTFGCSFFFCSAYYNYYSMPSPQLRWCLRLDLLASFFIPLIICALKMGFDMESLLEATLGAIGDLVSTTVLYPLDIKPKFEFTISRSTGRFFSRFYFPFVLWVI